MLPFTRAGGISYSSPAYALSENVHSAESKRDRRARESPECHGYRPRSPEDARQMNDVLYAALWAYVSAPAGHMSL